MYEYKIKQLKLMLEAEISKDGGYGAHVTHWTGWAGQTKAINIDAGALEALIRHYEMRDAQKTHKINVYVEGGMVQFVKTDLPKDIEVELIVYDADCNSCIDDFDCGIDVYEEFCMDSEGMMNLDWSNQEAIRCKER